MREPTTSLILGFVWDKHPCLWQGQHWLSFTLCIWLSELDRQLWLEAVSTLRFLSDTVNVQHVSAHLWVSIYRLQDGDILGLGFFYLYQAYPVLLIQARACFLSSTGKNRKCNCCCMTSTKTCVIWSWTVLHVQHLSSMPSAPTLSGYSR